MKVNNSSVVNVSNYSYVNNAYNKQKISATNSTPSSDKLEISDTAQLYSSYLKEVKGSVKIDEAQYQAHVQNIEKQINEGSYKLNPYQVAEKLLSFRSLRG